MIVASYREGNGHSKKSCPVKAMWYGQDKMTPKHIPLARGVPKSSQDFPGTRHAAWQKNPNDWVNLSYMWFILRNLPKLWVFGAQHSMTEYVLHYSVSELRCYQKNTMWFSNFVHRIKTGVPIRTSELLALFRNVQSGVATTVIQRHQMEFRDLFTGYLMTFFQLHSLGPHNV
jgi:hypothetical protein